jgi:hypothetical protein
MDYLPSLHFDLQILKIKPTAATTTHFTMRTKKSFNILVISSNIHYAKIYFKYMYTSRAHFARSFILHLMEPLI